MNVSFKAFGALIALIAVLVLGAAPAQAAKVYFGTQEHLRQIQDVEVKGPKGEALYLGHKYSFHSFIAPYRITDDGYILGVRGEQRYYRLDDATIKSMQARGQLPTPLPPYQLSLLDYAMGHLLWIVLAVIIGLIPLSMLSKRRRKRALPHFEDGITRHQTGDFRGAAESYGRAIEIDPKFAAAFYFRGNAYAAVNDLKAAISEHTKAIRIEPKFADALTNRGILMRETGNFDGAVSDFSRVIKLNKKDANALYQRGLSYLGKGDFRRAIADFTKVIKIGAGVFRGVCSSAPSPTADRAMANARKRIKPRHTPSPAWKPSRLSRSAARGIPSGSASTRCGLNRTAVSCRISRDTRLIARTHAIDVWLRELDAMVRHVDQRALDLPHVPAREAPVVVELAQIVRPKALDAAGRIDIGVEVAHRERAQRLEHRLAAVQPGIARARHRAPAPTFAVEKEHMVEAVDQLEGEQQRRVAVVLEHAGREQRGFEAVRRAMPHHLPEAPQRVAALFRVVGQPVEIALHRIRRAQPLDQAALGGGEGSERGRTSLVQARPALHACL